MMVPRFCAICGNALQTGTRFCPACGWKVSSEEETGPQQANQAPGQGEASIGQDHAAAYNTPPPVMEPPIQAQQGFQPPPPFSSSAPSAPEKPPSKKGLLIGIIAGASVLMIAAMALGGFFILRSLRSTEPDQKISEALSQYEQKLEQETQASMEEVVDLGIQDTDTNEETDAMSGTLDENGEVFPDERNEDVSMIGDLKASRYAPTPGNKYVFEYILEGEWEGEKYFETFDIELLSGKFDKSFLEGELICSTMMYTDGEYQGIYHYITRGDALLEIYEYGDYQQDPVFVLLDDFYEGMQFGTESLIGSDPDGPILEVMETGRFVSLSGLEFEDCIILTGKDKGTDSVVTFYLAPGHGKIFMEFINPEYTQIVELKKIDEVDIDAVDWEMMMEMEEKG